MKIRILMGCVFAGRDLSAGKVISVTSDNRADALYLVWVGLAEVVTAKSGSKKKK